MDDTAALSETQSLADQRDDRPFANEAVALSKLDYIELKARCHSYKALFERALERKAGLKRELETERAKVRDLNQRLYGRKSEQRRHGELLPKKPVKGPARPRVQQPGSRGHGPHHVPTCRSGEIRDLSAHENYCADCGLPLRDLGTTEDSEIFEIQVAPYIRKIRRKKSVNRPGYSGD